jgi:uncharacterized protein
MAARIPNSSATPMNSRAQIRFLPDGRRLHLQDGPIDVIVQAFGKRDAVESA